MLIHLCTILTLQEITLNLKILNCRDASWESGNAYAELLERPNMCSAPKCLCPSRGVRKKKENERVNEAEE